MIFTPTVHAGIGWPGTHNLYQFIFVANAALYVCVCMYKIMKTETNDQVPY